MSNLKNAGKNVGEVLSRFTSDKGKPYVKIVEECPRCGGTGHFSYCERYGSTCFKCDGSGTVIVSRRVLTEKEKRQRERAKERKEEKRQLKIKQEQEAHDKKVRELLKGSSYKVMHNNTYEIKEELKSLGAKWCYIIGWHFDTLVQCDFALMEIPNNLIYDGLSLASHAVTVVKSMTNEYYGVIESEHMFEEGEKIDVNVVVDRISGYCNAYGYKNVYVFKIDHNVLIWDTAKDLDINKGDKLHIKATVKGHDTYNGEKQTKILRVKIIK